MAALLRDAKGGQSGAWKRVDGLVSSFMQLYINA